MDKLYTLDEARDIIKGKVIQSLVQKAAERLAKHDPIAGDTYTMTNRSAGGSQGGRWFVDQNGQQHFGKHYGGNTDRLASEHLSNQLYRMMGISAPETKIVKVKGVPYLMSKELPGEPAYSSNALHATDAHKGFVTDAWLGNWDTTGLDFDNMLIDDGKVHRIDNGGSLVWRAQGKPKPFPREVGEIDTMRDPSNPSGQVFGHLSNQEVASQIDDFTKKYRANRGQIDTLVDNSGLSKPLGQKIKQALHDRAAWLANEGKMRVGGVPISP